MESPAGCAGEGIQRKGNIGKEKRTVHSAKFEFCDESRAEGVVGGGGGRERQRRWR